MRRIVVAVLGGAALWAWTNSSLLAGQPDVQGRQQPATAESLDQSTNLPADARQPGEGASPETRGQRPNSPTEKGGAELGVIGAPSPGGGVLVQRIDPRSAAARVGIAPGDYILSVNEQPTTDPNELRAQIDRFAPGQQVRIEFWRNGERRQLEVPLGESHAAGYRGVPREAQEGEGSQAWLGVAIARGEAGQGVEVTDIHPAGPAAFAGLRLGDVIERVDDEPIASPEDITRTVAERRPGTAVQLTILRDGKQQTLRATLRTRPGYLRTPNGYGYEGVGSYEEEDEDFDESPGESMAPEHAMMLEQHRHFAEQHERIENLLNDLVKEVQALRQDVRQLQESGQADAATSADELTEP